ncbi:MAG: sigma-54-dependent transcriptional regulator [Planctomycetaceae bacterium]
MSTLLAIDDEPLILDSFRYLFPQSEVRLLTATNAAEGLRVFSESRPDVVTLDVGLPDMSGLETLRRFREIDARVPIILLTGQGTAATAIEAMRLGAFEYALKPLDADQLVALLKRAFEVSRLMRVPATVPSSGLGAISDDQAGDVLIGCCPAMQIVYKSIGRVAPQNVTVLILGESGTGKELVARAIYHYSRRADKPFLAINCAAIPENLLESELFGHEKGAFTGADRRRIGKFEQCHGGTLFLDEVGEMSPLTQTKILRILQEQTFERVGGSETIKADVRVIAATNRDLESRVNSGEFRGDLFYRLNVFSIRLPPLRERGEDIPLLARHFLRKFSREFGRETPDFSQEALDLVSKYSWPGNIRELQSVIKQALLETVGPVIVPDFMPPSIRTDRATTTATDLPGPAPAIDVATFIRARLQLGSTNLHAEAVLLLERILLPVVLRHTAGNLTQAARILGITRPTLRVKLAEAGLVIEKSLSETPHGPQGVEKA